MLICVRSTDFLIDLRWNPIENKLDGKLIRKLVTKLSCESYLTQDREQQPRHLTSPFRIIVSTLASSTHEASLYYVDPTPGAMSPWQDEPFARSAGRILDCVSATPFPLKDHGHYVLSQSETANEPISCTMSAEAPRDILLHKLAKPNSLWSSMNCRG